MHEIWFHYTGLPIKLRDFISITHFVRRNLGYTWYYTHNAARFPHFIPIMELSSYILRTRGILIIMQHSLTSTSVDLSTIISPISSSHIALFRLYFEAMWYYIHNVTFYYIYFHRPVDQHFPYPSSVSTVIWLSLRMCMCPAPTCLDDT